VAVRVNDRVQTFNVSGEHLRAKVRGGVDDDVTLDPAVVAAADENRRTQPGVARIGGTADCAGTAYGWYA